MERFVIIVKGWKPLTIITKRSILDVAAALNSIASVTNSFRILKGCISVRLIDKKDLQNPTKSSDH